MSLQSQPMPLRNLMILLSTLLIALTAIICSQLWVLDRDIGLRMTQMLNTTHSQGQAQGFKAGAQSQHAQDVKDATLPGKQGPRGARGEPGYTGDTGATGATDRPGRTIVEPRPPLSLFNPKSW